MPSILHSAMYYVKSPDNIGDSARQGARSLIKALDKKDYIELPVQNVCKKLNLKLVSDDNQDFAQNYHALLRYLELIGLRGLPFQSGPDIAPDTPMYILKKVESSADMDIYEARKLSGKQAALFTVQDHQILRRAQKKVKNHQLLLHIYELLAMVTEQPLHEIALRRLYKIKESLDLPKFMFSFHQAFLLYAANHGAYLPDFSKKELCLQPLDKSERVTVFLVIADLCACERVSLRPEALCRGYPYYAELSKKCRDTEFLNPAPLRFEKKTKTKTKNQPSAYTYKVITDKELQQRVMQLSGTYLWRCRAFDDGRIATLRARLQGHMVELARLPLDFEILGTACSLGLCRNDDDEEGLCIVAGYVPITRCNLPFMVLNKDSEVDENSPLQEGVLKSPTYLNISEQLRTQPLDQRNDLIAHTYLNYLLYRLLYENMFEGKVHPARKLCFKIASALHEGGNLSDPLLGLCLSLYYLVCEFDPTKEQELPGFLFKALESFPCMYALYARAVYDKCKDTPVFNLPRSSVMLILCDLLNALRPGRYPLQSKAAMEAVLFLFVKYLRDKPIDLPWLLIPYNGASRHIKHDYECRALLLEHCLDNEMNSKYMQAVLSEHAFCLTAVELLKSFGTEEKLLAYQRDPALKLLDDFEICFANELHYIILTEAKGLNVYELFFGNPDKKLKEAADKFFVPGRQFNCLQRGPHDFLHADKFSNPRLILSTLCRYRGFTVLPLGQIPEKSDGDQNDLFLLPTNDLRDSRAQLHLKALQLVIFALSLCCDNANTVRKIGRLYLSVMLPGFDASTIAATVNFCSFVINKHAPILGSPENRQARLLIDWYDKEVRDGTFEECLEYLYFFILDVMHLPSMLLNIRLMALLNDLYIEFKKLEPALAQGSGLQACRRMCIYDAMRLVSRAYATDNPAVDTKELAQTLDEATSWPVPSRMPPKFEKYRQKYITQREGWTQTDEQLKKRSELRKNAAQKLFDYLKEHDPLPFLQKNPKNEYKIEPFDGLEHYPQTWRRHEVIIDSLSYKSLLEREPSLVNVYAPLFDQLIAGVPAADAQPWNPQDEEAAMPQAKTQGQPSESAFALDQERIDQKIKESLQVQAVIGEIVASNDRKQPDAPPSAPQDEAQAQENPKPQENAQSFDAKPEAAAVAPSQAPIASLSEQARMLIKDLIDQRCEQMDLKEFEGMCLSLKFMSMAAAVEEINDWACEFFDDLIADCDYEGSVVYFTSEILDKLKTV